jgi:hypothetical protein
MKVSPASFGGFHADVFAHPIYHIVSHAMR